MNVPMNVNAKKASLDEDVIDVKRIPEVNLINKGKRFVSHAMIVTIW